MMRHRFAAVGMPLLFEVRIDQFSIGVVQRQLLMLKMGSVHTSDGKWIFTMVERLCSMNTMKWSVLVSSDMVERLSILVMVDRLGIDIMVKRYSVHTMVKRLRKHIMSILRILCFVMDRGIRRFMVETGVAMVIIAIV